MKRNGHPEKISLAPTPAIGNGATMTTAAPPIAMPPVSIMPSRESITTVDCPELQWWFVAPGRDEWRLSAHYEVDTGRLDSVRVLTRSHPADVATWGPGAVELTIVETMATPPSRPWTGKVRSSATFEFVCRSDADRIRWLSVAETPDDGPGSRTDHHTPGFDDAWGTVPPRRIVDDGRFVPDAEAGLFLGPGTGMGARTFDVVIGERRFCACGSSTTPAPPKSSARRT